MPLQRFEKIFEVENALNVMLLNKKVELVYHLI